MSSSGTRHVSVMPNEVLEALSATRAGKFLDCTFGGGGHTEAILQKNKENTVLAIDRDIRALERGKELVKTYASRLTLVQKSFAEIDTLDPMLFEQGFDGMLADLGISTDQLFEQRGFSFQDSTALDMRMDESQEFSAATLVNTFPEHELMRIFKRGGAEREAHVVARAIVKQRPFENTRELVRCIVSAIGGKHRKKNIHPATLVFQALRIEVNSEFSQIDSLLDVAPKVLRRNGSLVILTFHSLEDKLVTNRMRQWEQGDTSPALRPTSLPLLKAKGGSERSVVEERLERIEKKYPVGKQLYKKALTPTELEVGANPNARSARLRAFCFENGFEHRIQKD